MGHVMNTMKRIRLTVVAATALAVLPTLAQAESPGLYIGLGAGATLPRESDLNGSPSFDSNADLDTGWKGIGSLGYKFPNGLRSELELGYGQNDVDSVSGATASGSFKHGSAMANAFYDFDNLLPWSAVTPFIGVGLGGGWLKADGINVPGTRIDDSDVNFAYQAMAGLNFDITDRLTANVGYRWFSIPSADFKADNSASVDSEYSAHMFMVGLRWSFGPPARPAPAPAVAPTPAPAPAPAPAPRVQVPSRYLVFFEFDRADLTPEGRQVVQQAAAAAKANNVVRIEATGHADRAGSDAYNQRLSQRRAETVRAELVRNGIRQNEIAVFAKGEREPLVPTPDGVREPQNRRVEIVFK
jgi:outer membrane protein OmpA-like peptidoglycan-associated protein